MVPLACDGSCASFVHRWSFVERWKCCARGAARSEAQSRAVCLRMVSATACPEYHRPDFVSCDPAGIRLFSVVVPVACRTMGTASGFSPGKLSGHVAEVTIPIRRGSSDAPQQGNQNQHSSPMEDAPTIFQPVNKAAVRFGNYTREKRLTNRRHRFARWLRRYRWFSLMSNLRLKQLGTAIPQNRDRGALWWCSSCSVCASNPAIY
jgi:hypothetical protein